MRRDSRSPETQAYHKLYNSTAWRIGRLQFLEENPLCERCLEKGRTTTATIVHHRIAHRGDLALFLDRPNWQAVCQPHHDIDIQSEERLGYSKEIGIDGWPVSESHPANGGHRDGLGPMSHPIWFRPVLVPLTIVCGPPASGKSTYVKAHAGPSDLVLDLDVIAVKTFGQPVRLLDMQRVLDCMRIRNERMGDLMRPSVQAAVPHAWLIVAEPKAKRRQWWADTVKPQRIVVLATPEQVCIDRATADEAVFKWRGPMASQSIREWWHDYTPRAGDLCIAGEYISD